MSDNAISSKYLAPYEPLSEETGEAYTHFVYFREGHSFDAHVAFVGSWLARRDPYVRGSLYSLRHLNCEPDDHFDQIRRDPGVLKVAAATRERSRAVWQTILPDYRAPYVRLPEGVQGQTYNSHVVYFHEGHDIDKHISAVGDWIRGLAYCQKLMYRINININEDEEAIELIRSDSGVCNVVEATKEISRAAMEANRSVITHPYARLQPLPSYHVSFGGSEGYTVAQHFARIGLEHDVRNPARATGYQIPITTPESQIDAILSDPHVWYVQQDHEMKWN